MALVFTLAVPSLAMAQLNADSTGLTSTGNAAYGEQNPDSLNVGKFIGIYIIQPVLGLTGLVFLVLTVYAGMMWMTAAGDSKRVEKAKSILIASVTGAVVIASSYAITSTVINALSPNAPGTTTNP